MVKAVMLEVPQELLDERRRKGQDKHDEVWDGVLHMVPPPSHAHQDFGSDLLVVLRPLAKTLGLVATYETGVFRPGSGDRDYRQPDLVVALPSQITKRGVEGACELIVEILSPDDETYAKLPFYADLGVREVLVATPETRTCELYVLRGGSYVMVSPDASGTVRSQVLGVGFASIPGSKLRLTWASGAVEI